MFSFLRRSRYLAIAFTLALALVFAHNSISTSASVGATQVAPPNTPPLQTVSQDAQPKTLLEKGRSAYQSQQIDEAIYYWQMASQDFEQQGDRLHQALALSYLSLAYQYQGAWPLAAERIDQSFQQLDQWQTSSKGGSAESSADQVSIIQGQIFNTKGALQFHQGNLEAALRSWQQAGELYQTAGDTQRYTGSLINQARTLQSLGYFLQARDALDQVQMQLEQAKPSLRLIGLHSLGDALRGVGDLEAAQAAFEEGLAIAQSQSRPQSRPREQAALLVSLGHIAQSQERPTEALAAYQKASVITDDPLQQAQAKAAEFGLLVDTQAWAAAQAVEIALSAQLPTLPASREGLYTQINFAHRLMQLQPPDSSQQLDARVTAAKLLAKAVQQAKDTGDRYAEAYATGYLGNAYEVTQQWAIAKDLTEDALLIAQTLNATDIAYQWQWQLGRILKTQGKHDAAMVAYQTALASLRSLRYDLAATAPDQQFSFRESVEPIYRDYVDLLLSSEGSSSEGSGFEGSGFESSGFEGTSEPVRLQQARDVMESLQIAELNNFFRSACIEGQAVALDNIDQTDAAIIYPIILNSRLEVIVSLPNQPLQHYATKISRDDVEATLGKLRNSLVRPFVTAESKRLGETVYGWLIRPIEAKLRQSNLKTLVFVLDGSLRSVPMSALYTGEHYLIEDYSVALTPGLQLVSPRSIQQQAIETIAAGLTEARDGFSALENVAQELDKVEATVPSRVLLNQNFTREALRSQIESRSYPVVHLATHGQFGSRAEDTFILTWDERLDVNEISAILQAGAQTNQTPIELLILSACETASGDSRAALGLAGVAVQAGARSTIASLWSLDDASGAKLVSHLYDELIKPDISRAEALRQAQLALMKDPNFQAPFYWSPFVLVGSWL